MSSAAISPALGHEENSTRKTFSRAISRTLLHLTSHCHSELDDAEKELNQWLVLNGHADVWQQLLITRNDLIQKRKKEELLAEQHAAARKKELD